MKISLEILQSKSSPTASESFLTLQSTSKFSGSPAAPTISMNSMKQSEFISKSDLRIMITFSVKSQIGEFGDFAKKGF